MRVELPSPNPGGTPEATPAAPVRVSLAPRPSRPTSTVERFVNAVTRPRWAWTLTAISLVLFVWALGVRRPVGERFLTVSARALALGGGPPGGTNFTASDLQRLQQNVEELKAGLVGSRKEILPLLFTLETAARKEGWRCERSMQQVQTFANTLTNLELHPVVFHLHPDRVITPGLYNPLLRWLQAVSALEKRAEIASLTVHADASGIQRADVRIHFFSLNPHAETSPK